MTAAVFIASAFIAGGGVGAVCGYIGGRRSSREELAAAQMAWAVQNAAPERDALSLPPERPDVQPVVMYQQTDEETLGPVAQAILAGDGLGPVARRFLPNPPDDSTWSGASHLQADPADDTGVGTVKFLSGEWAPAAPASKQVGQ